MPGAVPHTSTYALTNVTLPYAVELANRGWRDALRGRPGAGARAEHLRRRRSPTGRSPRRTACRTRSLDVRARADGAVLIAVTSTVRRRAAGLRRCVDAVRGLPRPPGGRARPGGEHARRLPPRPAPLPGASCAARGVDALGEVTEAHVAAFLAALRDGDDGPPAAGRRLGRPGRGRRPRAAPVRRCGRASSPTTRPRDGAAAGAARSGCPRRSRSTRSSGCSTAAGADGERPLALRDRALLEVLYGTGARISEAVGLDVDDLDLEPGRGAAARQGRQGAGRPARLATPARRSTPTWSGPGRRWPPTGAGAPALFLNARGGRLSRQSAWTVLRAAAERAGLGDGGLAAHAAALLRDPPARRRRRRPGRPGAARPRVGDHDAGLHAGHRRPAARGLRGRASRAPLASGLARRLGCTTVRQRRRLGRAVATRRLSLARSGAPTSSDVGGRLGSRPRHDERVDDRWPRKTDRS